MKPLAQIEIPVKGRSWKFMLLTDRMYDKIHNSDGGNSAAMTISTSYSVHFSKSFWDMENIRHELFHAFYAMAEVNSSALTPLQVEETMCSIYGSNGPEMNLIADRIAECFFNYNK